MHTLLGRHAAPHRDANYQLWDRCVVIPALCDRARHSSAPKSPLEKTIRLRSRVEVSPPKVPSVFAMPELSKSVVPPRQEGPSVRHSGAVAPSSVDLVDLTVLMLLPNSFAES